MDLDERLNKILNKKGSSKLNGKRSKKRKNGGDKSIFLQKISEAISFSSSDDDFEEQRFIVRSPRSKKAINKNQTYKEQLTPRRASDKTKSVRSQSRSRDRNASKSAAPRKYQDLPFTLPPKECLITDRFPYKKKTKSTVEKTTRTNCDSTHQKKKSDNLLSGGEDSPGEERNHQDDIVLVQDTEEDKTGKTKTNGFSNEVVADSLVPDTEEFQPRSTKSNEQSVADSLVMETQDSVKNVSAKGCEQTIPDSHVPDSSNESAISNTFASSSYTVPDSFVPESTGTRSTLGTSECEIDTILDSQNFLDPNGDSVQVQKCINEKENRRRLNKTKKKMKPKKPSKKLFDQIQYSSDSSVDDMLLDTFVETFNVDQNDTVRVNQLDTGAGVNMWMGMDPKNVDPRLLNTKNSDSQDMASNSVSCPKTSRKAPTKGSNEGKGVSKDDCKENKSHKKKKKDGRKKNIFDIFDFTSEDEEDPLTRVDDYHAGNKSAVSENPGLSVNTSEQVDATVIDELSQRLTRILSKTKSKKSKGRKNKDPKTNGHTVSGKTSSVQESISLQISQRDDDSMIVSNNRLSDERQDIGDSPVRELCNFSAQVSIMEESNLKVNESDEAESPPKYQNISLQVSVMDSGDEEAETEDTGPKDMGLQVSMTAHESSDEGQSTDSKDLALQISLVSDDDISSELVNKTGTAQQSLQDAQRDSLLTSDNDDTLLSNDSSVHSKEGEKTIFQTPPEEFQQMKKNDKSSGGSPLCDPFKTAKQHMGNTEKQPGVQKTKRKSFGLHSSSFYVPSSVNSPDDVPNPIPAMIMSDDEDEERTRSTGALKDRIKSVTKTPRPIQDETGYASMWGATSPRSGAQRARKYSDSSDDDELLESFLSKQKNPAPKPRETSTSVSMADFIVDDDSDIIDCGDEEDDEEDDSLFYVNVNRSRDVGETSATRSRRTFASDSDSEDENLNTRPTFKTPGALPKPSMPSTVSRTKSVAVTPKRTPLAPHNANTTGHDAYRWSFLRSLAGDTPNIRRHPDSMRYIRDFKKYKEELMIRLFKLFNETVFEKKLPENMTLEWNQRLYTTAGYCRYSKRSSTDKPRTAKIELSIKVCDSPERVRDTLLHEMCHAAVWIIYGVNDGHGPYWKYFASKASKAHPELPKASRCHNYDIFHKYTYRCIKCGYQIGRHSKSLDTKKKVCGYCNGEFELLVNKMDGKGSVNRTPHTPRAPNRFAIFVKENYDSVKKSAKGISHKDVMAQLSKDFAKTKLN